jgi:hypothetical protein
LVCVKHLVTEWFPRIAARILQYWNRFAAALNRLRNQRES